MLKKFNVSAPKNYKSGGVDKTFWLNVGSMIVNDDGKIFLTLNFVPNQTYLVSEVKPKDNIKQTPNQQAAKERQEIENEAAKSQAEPEVDISDIPF